ncbi:Mediator of RNA polymerase II transcription subunit 18 [Emmonsiellopsis sp. PD_5]|nr:Mediator of RNA polymerase II transcription subunit 18 [Emmonsiellopsis sp. PD_5]
MHELLLFAPVPAKQHHDLLQQLCGLTAMQPARTLERHLIFKAYRKPGFVKTRPGGSQDVQASEVQKLNKLLNGGLYYTQVVGNVRPADFDSKTPPSGPDVTAEGAGSVVVEGGYGIGSGSATSQAWRLEWKDTPEAGARSAVTSRLVGSVDLGSGNVIDEMTAWGYNYVSEYVVQGDTFILDDTVILLHRVLNFPAGVGHHPAGPVERLPPLNEMVPLDSSGGYILQASITVQDSHNPDMLKANSQRLLGLKEHLKSVVKLEPADRLSLDTRVK